MQNYKIISNITLFLYICSIEKRKQRNITIRKRII